MSETFADNPRAMFVHDCETGETVELYVGPSILKSWAETLRRQFEE